jgi:hypothetical protein
MVAIAEGGGVLEEIDAANGGYRVIIAVPEGDP